MNGIIFFYRPSHRLPIKTIHSIPRYIGGTFLFLLLSILEFPNFLFHLYTNPLSQKKKKKKPCLNIQFAIRDTETQKESDGTARQ